MAGSAKDDQDFRDGKAAGIKAAETFEQVRTHTMTAPSGHSADWEAGWRVGFSVVRVRKEQARQNQHAEILAHVREHGAMSAMDKYGHAAVTGLMTPPN